MMHNLIACYNECIRTFIEGCDGKIENFDANAVIWTHHENDSNIER